MRSFSRRLWSRVSVVCLALAMAPPAFAQLVQQDPPEDVELLSRYDFTMAVSALRYADDRFSWDAHWAGDVDFLDYRRGRGTFYADYQVLAGSGFRPFDPYQGNYTLGGSASVRLLGAEFAGIFNHVSRHLGDRFKLVSVAENSLGVRVLRRISQPKATLDVRIDLRKVVSKAYVDYTSISEIDVTAARTVNPVTRLYGRMYGQFNTVDGVVAGRSGQYGGRVEAGVQLRGAAGTMDLFVGSERVIDADPLDRIARRWAFAGFRLKPN